MAEAWLLTVAYTVHDQRSAVHSLWTSAGVAKGMQESQDP